MHISDIFARDPITFSFEFFPPKTTEASEQLFTTISNLQELRPSFVSVTYGAGGSTRERTHDLIVRIQRETQLTAISHLTCVCHSEPELCSILERYAESGIENILALRGDPPRDRLDYDRNADAFQYAEQLVKFIASRWHSSDSRGFGVGVAGFPEGHPECPNRLREIEYLKRKVDAGAQYICTQLFFDNRDFYDFRERCDLAGIRVPILAGIMPVSSRTGLARMCELALGARIPAPLLRAIHRCKDDESASKVGLHWATEQCRGLLDHQVRGVHFYTLNKSDATRQIYTNLGVADSYGFRTGAAVQS